MDNDVVVIIMVQIKITKYSVATSLARYAMFLVKDVLVMLRVLQFCNL
jgi:hypothetical protein